MRQPRPFDVPLTWPLAALLQAYRRRELSPAEVASEALDRIARFDPVLHAFLHVDDAATMAQATTSGEAYGRGDPRPLEGVPISVKDVFHVRGWPTTCGSMASSRRPATEDSGVVSRLRAAGAVLTGKTNTSEFGQSATTENLLGDDAANPWDVTRTAGGSSGGAAASVVAGLSSAAIGTDGGGSIRIPAAFCGAFGIKPTHGTCADEGGLRAMTEFSSPGPLAWSAADARLLLVTMRGTELAPDRRGVRRIGVCRRPEQRPVDRLLLDAFDHAVEVMQGLVPDVAEIELPIDRWNEVFGILVVAEEGHERGGLLDAPERLTDYERRTLLAARDLTPSQVAMARSELDRIRTDLRRLFATIDVVMTPTTAVPAFPLRRRPRSIEGEPVTTLWGAFPFTAPFNLLGAPAASVPCGLVDSMPVGVQLVAAPGRDATLLDIAEQLQDRLGFDTRAVLRP